MIVRLQDKYLKNVPKLEVEIPKAVSKGETASQPETVRRGQLLPPYAVILHNDDVNEMGYVTMALLRSVPKLTEKQAAEIMLTAHHRGQAVVIVCPLELAELYRERLEGYGLTATIEKA
ncbi:MAG: ATP-dependent Clp protease adaptor ClpS [Chloroflexi bacterium]|nr:ATP-dependent Clp protease adaptor ClpS [Chloroflexota bacterium]